MQKNVPKCEFLFCFFRFLYEDSELIKPIESDL